MNDPFLLRYSYAPTETEGVLRLNGFTLATLERPWIPGFSAGGRPFESCVPDGDYMLEPWTRPSGEEVFLLSNPDLGVYRYKEDRPEGKGRYLILIHVANFIDDIVGCIAPGTKRRLLRNPETGEVERAVSNSGEAMRIIRDELGNTAHTLTIRSNCGTGG